MGGIAFVWTSALNKQAASVPNLFPPVYGQLIPINEGR